MGEDREGIGGKLKVEVDGDEASQGHNVWILNVREDSVG